MPIPNLPPRTDVGPIIAAIPTHQSEEDVSEWIVVCLRDDFPPFADRPYCTLSLQVLVDERLARWGNYDMTYEEALRDLYRRVGVTADTLTEA
jgi:hypothetical protein